MLDLKYLREHGAEIKFALQKKKFPCDIDAFLALDSLRRERISRAELARAELKRASDQLAKSNGSGKNAAAIRTSLKEQSAKAKELSDAVQALEGEWQRLYLSIPNVPHESVPTGKTERDNVAISSWSDASAISPHAMPHYEIPGFADGLDFARGAKVAGAGFPFYIGDMARLVRALIQFFLSEAEANGYVEFLPPLLVNAASATATGQLPDKEGMMYEMPTDGFYAVPTAEIPITNFFRDEILREADLPIRRCAHTPCFRREAGSWGKDVRGLNRLHQFDKVELVKWVHPSRSLEELELLRGDAEGLLQKLKIPYRVLAICSGDMGFPHSKQYDLEVWSGGQKRWLEVSSCSSFTDFQARRANIRFRPTDGPGLQFVHTLNGSGLAIPRVLAAIMENNLQEDGSVRVPPVLHRFFGRESAKF
ncbi:MAG: serine--tRNA ligase [Puniceicoccales bacterium]|jgi:seryl-tRNA synthetase|nr:serine--tRNA ligase [Puniceicoccales bacterium]